MHESDRVIDEYTLAAFLAGTLAEERRQEVIEYLAANADAREVLQMAAGALEAARGAEPVAARTRVDRPARAATPRRTRRRRAAWMGGAGRYAAATVFVFVVGMVLRLSFGPPTDSLRSPLDRSGTVMRVDVDVSGPTIEWPAVVNAYRYRLVIWDPAHAEVAGQYDTSDNQLEREHPVVQDMQHDLEEGLPYMLRVDAIDAQNRLIRSSETVEFVLE